MTGLTSAAAKPPLAGVRVLEYAQYVAGPFAGMLLADLGADVIKVEPPSGDAWRHYEPFAPGQSRYFYSLNRNKRSVVVDLKTDAGRRDSERLIAGAEALIHNFSAQRAAAYGLDRERVREVNPRAVWCSLSALGPVGPDADVKAFDLIAQAVSGLLLADVRPDDDVPRRAGGIAMADFTAGLLAAIALLGGLYGARREPASAPGVEISLLGAALAVQVQRLVSVQDLDAPARAERRASASSAGPGPELASHADRIRAADELEPYYRAYRAADGFLALACLNERQRRALLEVLGAEDPFVANPQAPPADARERAQRLEHVSRLQRAFASTPAQEWVARLRAAGVPAATVRSLDEVYDDPQVSANRLIETLEMPGVGEVRQLGSVFKVDGIVAPSARPAPELGQHTLEVLGKRKASAA